VARCPDGVRVERMLASVEDLRGGVPTLDVDG
jgi:hypothetical protein